MSEPRPRSRLDRAALVALPVYWIALFVATHLPRVRIPDEIPQSDKVVHFSAFGLLAFLVWRFRRVLRPIGDRFVWILVPALIAYAGFDEYLQQFFGRYTDVADFVANTSGIVAVATALELHRRYATRRAAT